MLCNNYVSTNIEINPEDAIKYRHIRLWLTKLDGNIRTTGKEKLVGEESSEGERERERKKRDR